MGLLRTNQKVALVLACISTLLAVVGTDLIAGTEPPGAAAVAASPPSVRMFLVENILDDGPGSLRWAIQDANNATNGDGPDRIVFAIPGPGPHVIAPLSPLPAILDPVVIDGYTQPGSSPNSSVSGSAAVFMVELDGRGARDASGLLILAGETTVRGLSIHGFAGDGIRLEERGLNRVEGNLIGSLSPREPFARNAGHGVAIAGVSGNVIGGTSPRPGT